MKEIEHEIDQFYYEMDQGEAPIGNILCIYIDKEKKGSQKSYLIIVN